MWICKNIFLCYVKLSYNPIMYLWSTIFIRFESLYFCLFHPLHTKLEDVRLKVTDMVQKWHHNIHGLGQRHEHGNKQGNGNGQGLGPGPGQAHCHGQGHAYGHQYSHGFGHRNHFISFNFFFSFFIICFSFLKYSSDFFSLNIRLWVFLSLIF